MGNNSVCKRLSSKLFLNSITDEMDYLVYRWTSFCVDESRRKGGGYVYRVLHDPASSSFDVLFRIFLFLENPG